MNIKKVLAGAVASVMAVTTFAALASAEKAGLSFQTGSFSFRNNPNQNTAYWWDEDQEQMEFDTWTYTDAEITQDGQYSVSFEKDDSDGAVSWKMLKLQFLISQTDYPDFAVTIDSFKIDGKDVAAGLTATLGVEEIKPDDYTDTDFEGKKDYYVVGFYNTYNSDMQFIKSDDYGNKVEVTFTVSGFKAADGGDSTEAPAGDATQAGTDAPATTPDKNQPDTGVEGVAVVAGLAILATGAIVVAKKRK